MKLSDQQAHVLLDVLKASLQMSGGFAGFTHDYLKQLYVDIHNQQDKVPRELGVRRPEPRPCIVENGHERHDRIVTRTYTDGVGNRSVTSTCMVCGRKWTDSTWTPVATKLEKALPCPECGLTWLDGRVCPHKITPEDDRSLVLEPDTE